MTLNQWLKTKERPPGYINGGVQLHRVTGDFSFDPDFKDLTTGLWWFVDVLEDGTAITWCGE